MNPQLNTLKNELGTIRVESKVMQLLGFLVQRQGQVCSKADILDEIWPKQVVADDAVTRLIFVLRNALGDNAKSPQFISTVPKKGYVFLVKATPLAPTKKYSTGVISSCCVLLLALVAWFNWPGDDQPLNYQVSRTIPVTHQEGREYSYAIAGEFDAYFHEMDNLTRLMITRSGQAPAVLVESPWPKHSLVIVDKTLFYIQQLSGRYQIVQLTLDGSEKVLFESDTPIFSLSFDEKNQHLLFNHYLNNDSTVLYQYSFVSEQVAPYSFSVSSIPKQIYSHFYRRSQDVLFFVGLVGEKPTIYGLRGNETSYRYQVNDFDNVVSLSGGKRRDELLVVGSYQFLQGIWSVSLKTGEKTLIYSHPDNDITQALLGPRQEVLYYSFQGLRTDLKQINLSGVQRYLPNLNSTLIDDVAKYFPDGQAIYFASNRKGDFELYRYQLDEAIINQVSQLNARIIWHYSFSSDAKKMAVVYSTDHIRLGVLDVATGRLLNSIPLDELKFPLGWSRDDKHIYVSEHLTSIAMYLYDAERLEVKQKRQHVGLTAYELSPGEVVAFDYQTKSFVAYDFNTDVTQLLSAPVQNYMSLFPSRAYTNGKLALLLFEREGKKIVKRLRLSKDATKRETILVANILQQGRMQDFSPDMTALLFAEKDKRLSGNIIALQLK